MNKAYKLLIVFVILICSCSSSNNIILGRKDSDKPVVLRMNAKQKVITVIELPFILRVQNTSIFKKEFGQIIYEYGFKEKGAGIFLYENDNKITNNQLKSVGLKGSLQYLVYSGHFTDFTEFTQQQLKPYVTKMLELDQDTLHVGTVAEFKKRHPELFKMLTENDTISIRHLKGRNSGLGERIATPANW